MIAFRYILYFLLLITSAMTLLLRPYVLDNIRSGVLDPKWILVGPIFFCLLFVIYIGDEIYKSRSVKSRSSLSLAHIVFGLVLLLFLLPSSLREYQTRKTPSITTQAFFADLMRSKDARVRAMVMMATSCHKNDENDWARLIEKGLSDSDPMVKDAAKFALERRLGIQLPDGQSGIEGAKSALKNWNESFFVAKKSIL